MSNPEDAVLCTKCVEGFVLPGTPLGKEEKVGPYNTYVSSPSTSANSKVAVVFLTDLFGIGLPNNRIIPDIIAKQLDVTVYVPDVFHGNYPSDSILSGMPTTAEDARKVSLFQKVKSGAKFATVVPWVLTHLPPSTFKETEEFLKVLKTERGHSKLAGVGYCYGGKSLLHFNATGHFDATVACHPSFIKPTDLEAIKAPTLFVCAEEDPQFGPAYAKKAEEILKKNNVESVFDHYPNTVHGFACRPDLSKPDVKAGFEKALTNTIAFFSKHLEVSTTSPAPDANNTSGVPAASL